MRNPKVSNFLLALLGITVLAGSCSREPKEKKKKLEAQTVEALMAEVPDRALRARSFVFAERELPEIRPPEKTESPMSLTASDGTGLRIVDLVALGVVQEPLAFTQVKMVFENPQDRQIEGRFRITMPPEATISRFAMKLGDKWQEGEVVERQAARRAYEDFLHRRQDPALLEQQAGNEFTARVFPIPPRGKKELIVSYSQELKQSSQPYRILLKGLPKMDHLKVRVLVGERAEELEKRGWIPDKDFEVAAPKVPDRMGLRHENLVVARVSPDIEDRVDEVGSLFVLVDTSASRALGFSGQMRLVGDLVAGLSRGAGAEVPLGVAGFDQEVELIYEGQAGGFGSEQIQAIKKRRALGASDLHGAVSWLAGHMQESGKKYQRVLVVTDGVATAGECDGDRLRQAVKALGGTGVERLDALVFGGIRDEAGLSSLVTAGLSHDGTVIEGSLELAEIARRLTEATVSDLKVAVEGAEWVWPQELDGVQSGDEVLVYADVPADRALKITIAGKQVQAAGQQLHKVERPLLQRAWVRARIDRLLNQRDTLASGDKDMRAALVKQVIDLSVKNRVLCPYTALLVLETEADYRRFNIDRRALVDIMTVGPQGIEMLDRKQKGAGLQIAKDPETAKKRSAEIARKRTARKEEIKEKIANKGLLRILGAEGAGGQEGEQKPLMSPTTPPAELDGIVSTPDIESLGTRGAGASVNSLIGGDAGGALDDAFSGIGGLGVAESPGTGRGVGLSYSGRRQQRSRVMTGRPEIRGALPREVVRRVIRRRMSAFKHCYEGQLPRNPGLSGRMELHMTIGPKGRVTRAEVQNSTMNNRSVEQCIKTQAKRMTFPQPQGGGIVEVTYPLTFHPGEAGSAPAGRPKPPKADPYTGKFAQVMELIDAKKSEEAHALAFGWREEDPGDVLALVALGEVWEAAGKVDQAARAYGSLIDLFPSRADIRRFAGQRLERLGGEAATRLASDTYLKAVEQRPDHPASHRLYAFALLKQGRPREAFEAVKAGLSRKYPSGRFRGVMRILKEDLGLAAAAWIKAEPKLKAKILEDLKAAGGSAETGPSLRFVLTWETDANDVDFHIHDGRGGHAFYSQKQLPSGGELYADVTTGYGPECFTIRNQPDKRAYPYWLQAHYYRRGPMGYGMGKLQIIEHDGRGGLKFEERPFVVMKDGAYLDLGKVKKRL